MGRLHFRINNYGASTFLMLSLLIPPLSPLFLFTNILLNRASDLLNRRWSDLVNRRGLIIRPTIPQLDRTVSSCKYEQLLILGRILSGGASKSDLDPPSPPPPLAEVRRI